MNELTCPHCKYEHEDWHEYVDGNDMEATFPMECEDCGKTFKVNYKMIITFETEI